MTQLREDRTYRTRDGRRTGIRVTKNPQFYDLWYEAGCPPAGTYNGMGRMSSYHEMAHDLVEDALQPFSYSSCPIVDGRRRAVTRDGRYMILLCDNAPGKCPIKGYYEDQPETLQQRPINGRVADDREFPGDLLVPPPPKRTLWINLAETGGYSTFNSEEEADQAATGCKRIGNRAVPVEVTV